MSLRHDQEQRKRALDTNTSFIVQAPAGSGKTELLTQRFLSLLTTANQPEEIIAITFTNKAVEELRARIIHTLMAAESEPEPTVEHRLIAYRLAKKVIKKSHSLDWQLIENPQRLKISTIDAFCYKLSQQLPITAKCGTQLNITNHALPLYQLAVKHVFTALTREQSISESVKKLFLHTDNHIDKFSNLLCHMLATRDQWLPIIFQAKAKPILENALKYLIELQLQTVSATLDDSLEQALCRLVQFAASNLKDHKDFQLEYDSKQLPLLTASKLCQWKSIARLFFTKQGTIRKQANAQIGFPALTSAKSAEEKVRFMEYKQHYIDFITILASRKKLCMAFKDLLALPNPQYTDQQWDILDALLEILPTAVAELKLVFIQQNQVDYTENALSALNALSSHETTDISMILDHQIQHILIDEFQDTSVIQYALLQKLTAHWEANEGKTLFLVGDPMQSIYRFRQAEVGLFLKAKIDGINQIRLQPLQLTQNFRSSAALIDWFNETFSAIFPKENQIAKGQITYHPSTPTQRTIAKTALEAQLFEKNHENAEAQWICKRIQAIKQQETNASIAILVRARSHLQPIIAKLEQAGISYQGVDIDPLASIPVIQDLLTLANAILQLGDRLAWLALLRTPWCGLTLADLTLVADTKTNETGIILQNLQDETIFKQLSQEGKTRVTQICNILPPIIQQRDRLSVSEQLRICFDAFQGNQLLTDDKAHQAVKQFFNTLTTIEQQERLTPQKLKQAIAEQYALPERIEATYVQLMTIHKAKGLEFDHVFLPDLARRSAVNNKPLLLWHEYIDPDHQQLHHTLLAPLHRPESCCPIYDFIYQKEQEKSQHELIRVLYVAATRAKHSLYLSASIQHTDKPISPDKQALLGLLWPTHHALFLNTASIDHQDVSDRDNPQALLATSYNTIKRIPVSAIKPNQLTQLNYAIGEHNTPELFDTTHSAEAAIGTMTHQVLYHISQLGFAWWEEQTIEAQKRYIYHACHQLGILETEHLMKQTLFAINQTLSDDIGRWILTPHVAHQSEYAILGYQDTIHKTYLIDRTFVEQGCRWIIDYKTAICLPGAQQEFLQQAAKTHYPQLSHYKKLMQSLEDRPIKIALYFNRLQKFWVYP